MVCERFAGGFPGGLRAVLRAVWIGCLRAVWIGRLRAVCGGLRAVYGGLRLTVIGRMTGGFAGGLWFVGGLRAACGRFMGGLRLTVFGQIAGGFAGSLRFVGGLRAVLRADCGRFCGRFGGLAVGGLAVGGLAVDGLAVGGLRAACGRVSRQSAFGGLLFAI